MENTRLFKIIIIIVWRTQDIKVFSSTNAEGSGGGCRVRGGGGGLGLIIRNLIRTGFRIPAAGSSVPL